MRRSIEATLGIKAYDIYGLTETSGPGVALECTEQTGMHVNEDHFFPEIVDPKTLQGVPEGETLAGYYAPTLIQPYDMFPQTKHVETLVCLVRKAT